MDQEREKTERRSSYLVGGVSLVITLISAITGVLDIIKENIVVRLGLIGLAIFLLILIIKVSKNNNDSYKVAQQCKQVNRVCITISVVLILLALFGVLESVTHSGSGSRIWPIEGCVTSQEPTPTPIPEIPDPADKIAAGNDFSMLLRSDKKVVTYGQATGIDTSSWENIIQIAAYKDHAIGLREDRTVIVTGKDYERYDVSGWSGIRQVVACKDGVVGVTTDGEIRFDSLNKDCMLDCQSWDHVQRIVGAACILVAERNDGSMIAANAWEVTDPYMSSLEKRIVSGTAVDDRMLLVLDNGRVKATGESSVLENLVATWTDILQVAVGNGFAIGLKEDNSVLSIGAPNNEELSVSGWENVAAICVGGSHILGLCKDGTVLTDGSEADGLANIAYENYWVNN